MKIAISAALVLGLVERAAGFGCQWNGAGSSYVYHDVGYNMGSYDPTNEPCVIGLTEEYAQTTCCRCATAAECNAPAPGNFNAFTNTTQGCDLYAPDIYIADAVEAASAPGMWFTSYEQLETYLYSTIKCVDDCHPAATCDPQWDPLAEQCANTLITVTSQDWLGCDNMNTAQKTFYVRYDDTPPEVTVELDQFLAKKSAMTKWEDVPLTITVSDDCTPYPEVSITVYSDEVTVKNPHRAAAVLERQYSNTGAGGVLEGWGITLDRTSYAKKLCGPTNECLEADGRYYIVRVCARDYAGNWACAEDSVGVPLTPAELKHVVPENQGKLFIVAQDYGFWGATPDELLSRNENIGLDAPTPAEYRLCASNYGMTGGTAGAPTTEDNVDACALNCDPDNGCEGFVFIFNGGSDNCYIYSELGTRDANIAPGFNIYVLADQQCPVVGAIP